MATVPHDSVKLSKLDTDLCVIALGFFRKSVERAARAEPDEDVKRIREQQVVNIDRVINVLRTKSLELS